MAASFKDGPTVSLGMFAWLLFGLVGVAATIFALSQWTWLTNAPNQRFVGTISVFLSVLGVMITLGGFILTFQQLMKVKTASAAVDTALAESRRSLAALTASSEVERAKLSIEAAATSIKSGSVGDLQDQLLTTRQCLFRIQERGLERFEDLHVEIAAAVGDIAQQCDTLHQADESSVKKLMGWLRPHIDLIDKLQVRIAEI